MSGNELPDDIQELKRLIIQQHAQIHQQQNEINHLQDIVKVLQRKKYAPQSEVVHSDQLGLFNDIEELAIEDNSDQYEDH
jgi:hypothetical protein